MTRKKLKKWVVKLFFNDYERGLINEAIKESFDRKALSMGDTLQEHKQKLFELRSVFENKNDLYK